MTNERQRLMDSDFQLNGLTFNLWRLKFGVYNVTARHADSGLGANIECKPELQNIEALNYCLSMIRFPWLLVLQSV